MIHQQLYRQAIGMTMGEAEISARLKLSNAQLRRLLALCANSLADTVRATQELSDRVSLLRDEIELLLADGRPSRA
ncbi:MAG: hypothetical protein JO288_07330 [Hyphomicrobiales bacterium]|nr:hypothetical protein [Hyphomicrobiales bacterium]